MLAMSAVTFFITQALIGSALCQTDYAVTSSTVAEMVGWVSPHDRRSSWGIIWSCLSIFALCSWRCIHLNFPTPEESQGGWHRFWGDTIPY